MYDKDTIYDLYDSAKGYDSIDYRAGRVIQSRELNEGQRMSAARHKRLGDLLMKDGRIVRGAGIVVDPTTGHTACEPGALWIDADVRGVEPAQLQVPIVGTVQVGVYLSRTRVTELQDESLRNPAVGMRGYQEPGAARTRVQLTWGMAGDGNGGNFYPLWTVQDGRVLPNDAPAEFDAIAQALSRYDRESAGGTYIVSGFEVRMAQNLASGEQVYTVGAGKARISGAAVESAATQRIIYAAAPDLLTIDSEPHQSTTAALQRIEFQRWPMIGVPQVRITKRRTVQVIHGGHVGAADPLPDTAIIAVEAVNQGGKNYTAGSDYKFIASQVDWSPEGAEPTPGSTYSVTYLHVALESASAIDEHGCSVQGAIAGTTIYVTYQQAMRRIDRLCLDTKGRASWLRGIAAAWAPVAPQVPEGQIAIASVYQTWQADRRVVADGVRVVPMQELSAMGEELRKLKMDTAEIRLAVDVAGRYSGVKRGTFADPLIDDAMRDAGATQSALIAGGALRLPMVITVHEMGQSISTRQTPAYSLTAALSQPRYTTSMKVNPYMAFDPLPCKVLLTPAIDRWVQVDEKYTGSQLVRVTTRDTSWDFRTEERITSKDTKLQYLREIEVYFELEFQPLEKLESLTFSGIAVSATATNAAALVADGQGLLKGKFRIPEKINAGAHAVEVRGSKGSFGQAIFTGQGTLQERQIERITYANIGWASVDPLAQTFTLSSAITCAGVKLWFADKGSSNILVQLREVENGMPTARVITQVLVPPKNVATDGESSVIEWQPLVLQAGREYAIVVGCDDAKAALHVAELGGYDEHAKRWVTSQPYQVGVLLSSSNGKTWTAHQDRDMAFELLQAQYAEDERAVDLGTVQVQGATDMMVQAYIEQPIAQATGTIRLQLKDQPPVDVAPGQVISLEKPYSGSISVQAVLRKGADTMAAMLDPGVQLICGQIQDQGDYITPWITATGGTRVRAMVDADLPAGSGVQMHCMTDAQGAQWQPLQFISSSQQTVGVYEITHELQAVSADKLRLRLQLAGSCAARPTVRNMRVVVL
jgi:hypothetical protein